jgi:hypothetical protein
MWVGKGKRGQRQHYSDQAYPTYDVLNGKLFHASVLKLAYRLQGITSNVVSVTYGAPACWAFDTK